MKPEERARLRIDELLTAAGWEVQDYNAMNLSASYGVAVRGFQLKADAADYLLFVDGEPVGVLEAKKEGDTLSGVSEQSCKYLEAIPTVFTAVSEPPPFAYESTGVETFFCNFRDPDARSRRVFAFHKPETLAKWLEQEKTLRAKLREMSSLVTAGLRDCQIEAITNLEKSFAETKPRALIQMATGSGKTFTAVSFVYRLIKHAGAKRVLFLVDRSNLGRQTLREFQQYVAPDDGRKFTELYNVQHLTANKLDPVCKVTITTIQRLFSMLKGEEDFDSTLEEESQFDSTPIEVEPKGVEYNAALPIESFDFIITDECHRSIYNLWRQALEYFDGFLIGLTATPSKQTLGFFNQNLVTEYSHEKAVADGVNVGYDVYTIKTKITGGGSKVDAGFHIDLRDRKTRQVRWQQLDNDFQYDANQLDRSVVARDQIRTVIKTFRDKLFTEIFPGRREVPKTLIFAKDDSHAEDIVEIVREEFGKGNDFCKKITYRTGMVRVVEKTTNDDGKEVEQVSYKRASGIKPEELVASFRNSYNPRIAVTVDMISTGTDIKPLECLIFMRDVKSSLYFEQMKGRGTRTISPDDFNAVTPDAHHKTHFVIVDAVGVCETDKTDSRPLERKRTVSFENLLKNVAMGNRDVDTLTSLANRLARLDRELSETDKQEITALTEGVSLKQITSNLLAATDPDKQVEKAQELFGTNEPDEAQLKKAAATLVKQACAPLDNPKLRDTLCFIKQRNEQIIDNVSQDAVSNSQFEISPINTNIWAFLI